MIDIGANLTAPAFDADRAEVIARARDAGVHGIVVTGTDLASAAVAADLVATREGLWSTAGVHPHDAKSVPGGWLTTVEALAARDAVVAVGETGLDFHRNYSPPDAQRGVFAAQIQLALRLDMPLFVHDRDSGGETARLLAAHDAVPERVVIHCFTGSRADLDAWLDAGYYIGITGWICDERRGGELRELAPLIPDERLLIETDAPYLLPRTMPRRGPGAPAHGRRNEPAFLPWVAREVARCRNATPQEVGAMTARNARRLFRLPCRPDLHGSTPPATGEKPALPHASAAGEAPPAEGSETAPERSAAVE